MLGVFILLALIASVLMVVGKNFSITATLAVIAALWAAVIGAILVARYRRQAELAETRSKDLRLVYELQLEREIAARRQYESQVENAIRAEVREEQNEEFEALKAQVLALRASLEQMLGNPLPEVPLALQPERRRELGSGLSGANYAGSGYTAATDDRVAADLDFASTAPPADPGRHAPAPEAAPEPDRPTPVEMTDIIPVTEDDTEYAEVEYEQPAERHDEQPYQPHYEQPQYQPPQPSYEQPVYEQPQYEQTAYPSAQYPQSDAPTGGFAAQAYDANSYQPPVPPIPDVPPMPQRPGAAADDDEGQHAHGTSAADLIRRLRQDANTRTDIHPPVD
ncbi:MAG: hypothetical protein QM774_09245 [Gordonia sp. (in: high G+C Gram-positive bacteria)]